MSGRKAALGGVVNQTRRELRIPACFVEAIDDQRLRLLGVLGTLQVLEAASQNLDRIRELPGCIGLLIEQMESIVERLELPSLKSAASARRSKQPYVDSMS